MVLVLFGLGSNLGDRTAALQAALTSLEPDLSLHLHSRRHETAPLYVTDQPIFLNMAAIGNTILPPLILLERFKKIEYNHGRREGRRFGPRPLDLDILYYGETLLESEILTIPHPRLVERSFVLEPLAEIAPDFRDPRTGYSILTLRNKLRKRENAFQ